MEATRRALFGVGDRIVHSGRGAGEVTRAHAKGELQVKFDRGGVRRYTPAQQRKLWAEPTRLETERPRRRRMTPPPWFAATPAAADGQACPVSSSGQASYPAFMCPTCAWCRTPLSEPNCRVCAGVEDEEAACRQQAAAAPPAPSAGSEARARSQSAPTSRPLVQRTPREVQMQWLTDSGSEDPLSSEEEDEEQDASFDSSKPKERARSHRPSSKDMRILESAIVTPRSTLREAPPSLSSPRGRARAL